MGISVRFKKNKHTKLGLYQSQSQSESKIRKKKIYFKIKIETEKKLIMCHRNEMDIFSSGVYVVIKARFLWPLKMVPIFNEKLYPSTFNGELFCLYKYKWSPILVKGSSILIKIDNLLPFAIDIYVSLSFSFSMDTHFSVSFFLNEWMNGKKNQKKKNKTHKTHHRYIELENTFVFVLCHPIKLVHSF